MQDRLGDELEELEVCSHDAVECGCKCHWPGNEPVIHDRACCRPCYRCGFRTPILAQDWRMKFLQ